MDDSKNKAPAASDGKGLSKPQHSNDSAAQRRRLLVRLQARPVTTIEARRDLDIMMPAARVFELRREGRHIDTVWIEQPTDCGKIHRVALYRLRLGAFCDSGAHLAAAAPETSLGASQGLP